MKPLLKYRPDSYPDIYFLCSTDPSMDYHQYWARNWQHLLDEKNKFRSSKHRNFSEFVKKARKDKR